MQSVVTLFFLLSFLEKPIIEDVQAGLSTYGISPLQGEAIETTEPLAQLLLAFYWLNQGDYPTAELLLNPLRRRSDFPFPDYVVFADAVLALEKEDLPKARELLKTFLENTQSIFSARALALLSDLFLKEGKIADAQTVAQSFEKIYASDATRATFLLNFVSYFLEKKEYKQAFLWGNAELLQWLPEETWRRDVFRPVVEKKWRAFNFLSEETQHNYASQMLSLLKNVALNNLLEEFLQKQPPSFTKWYELANLRYGDRDYPSAEKYARKALSLARQPFQSAQVYSLLSRISARKNQPSEALKNLDRMAKNPDARAEAWFRKADYLASLGREEEARNLFQKLIHQYPSSPYASSAHLWLFQNYLKNRQTEEASKILEQLATNPAYLPFSLYWKGKLEKKPELWQEILKEPYNYYALRILQETGQNLQPLFSHIQQDPEIPPAPEPWEERIRLLSEHSLFFFALEEARSRQFFSSGKPRVLFHLARLYHLLGDDFLAIHYAEKLLSPSLWKDFSRKERLEILRIAFPSRYFPILQEEAQNKNLDPNILLALIKQESRFDPRATSPANARGLMQILVSTGKAIASVLNIPFSPSILYDPKTNIQMGVHYFSELLNKFNGNPVLALAAYNWGPEKVSRWYASLPEEVKTDETALIELIPNSQPRLYVKKILLNYWIYQFLSSLPE
ncbi:MAG: lytic transglycosylase domain-containing protein [bacterium JZ-2024 1]